MTRYRVQASAAPSFRRSVSGVLLRHWAEAALTHLALPAGVGLDIALTDDETIRTMNRKYRGLDEPTDVLSFPFTDRATPALAYGQTGKDLAGSEGQGGKGFSLPATVGEPLGEIIISFPYARRQAAEHGHPPRTEVALLLVHGLLHLLGYDHEGAQQARAMTEKTHEVLSLLLT